MNGYAVSMYSLVGFVMSPPSSRPQSSRDPTHVNSSLVTEYGPYTPVSARVTDAARPFTNGGTLEALVSESSVTAFGLEMLVSKTEQAATTLTTIPATSARAQDRI